MSVAEPDLSQSPVESGGASPLCVIETRRPFPGGIEPLHRTIRLEGSCWARDVAWRDPTYLGSPAFWVEQTRLRASPDTYQVGATLVEEVGLCLLGGYGITEAMAYAAFVRIRNEGFLTSAVSEAKISDALSCPLHVRGHQRPVRYRFPKQKAQRLAQVMAVMASSAPPSDEDPMALRAWLMALPGVGPKTASWIVRNRTRSDRVAVIDIHIRRAGLVAGFFDPLWRLPRDYLLFEEAFVAWAAIGGVPTADLDACIWSNLASLGRAARRIFGVDRLVDLDKPSGR